MHKYICASSCSNYCDQHKSWKILLDNLSTFDIFGPDFSVLQKARLQYKCTHLSPLSIKGKRFFNIWKLTDIPSGKSFPSTL